MKNMKTILTPMLGFGVAMGLMTACEKSTITPLKTEINTSKMVPVSLPTSTNGGTPQSLDVVNRKMVLPRLPKPEPDPEPWQAPLVALGK